MVISLNEVATFAGAPRNPFTVYGAIPWRDSAVIGFQASTAIAQTTSIYLRQNGEVGSGTTTTPSISACA